MQTQLNKRLYTKAGIQEAMNAYQAVCEVSLNTAGDYYELTFSKVDPAVEGVLLDEFHNFALYSTIARKKTW